MRALSLMLQDRRESMGLKGPRAAQWLTEQGIRLPMEPNTWVNSDPAAGADGMLVARLGAAEFFLDERQGRTLSRISRSLNELRPGHEHPHGVYPVLREDWSFLLCGDGADDVLAQVCNVNFAVLQLGPRPLVMTLMIGVAVLVVPHGAPDREYRIWCDPSFGQYVGESLGAVVVESGGRYGRA